MYSVYNENVPPKLFLQ